MRMSSFFITCMVVSVVLPATTPRAAEQPANTIRVATFNTSLNRPRQGVLVEELKAGSRQAERVASILRLVRPDVVLLNEFDYDPDATGLREFRTRYLESEREPLAGETLVALTHSFTAPVNTGEPTGLDLDQDGKTDGPADAYGYGQFPGQYGMVILSRYPIDQSAVRTFQKLKWTDVPDAAVPIDPATNDPWYPTDVWKQLRLSSKSLWVVPVVVDEARVHVLASHPTPPAFDGPEDRNGRRNHDEIMLLHHMISGADQLWLRDDAGQHGGLPPNASFVICGDLNADPFDGGSYQNPIRRLLSHSRVRSHAPTSTGGSTAARQQGERNLTHEGDPRHDTADFSDRVVGNLRVDYCLPSKNLKIVDSGVFWPTDGEAGAELVSCSDHRLVWIDIALPSQQAASDD